MLRPSQAEVHSMSGRANGRALVRRNIARFPADFMFELTAREWRNLRYQFGTSSSGHGGHRRAPLAFTEHGVAMLSSVLRSRRAIEVNIAIMRAFTRCDISCPPTGNWPGASMPCSGGTTTSSRSCSTRFAG